MKPVKGEHPLGDSGQLALSGLFLLVWIADSFFLRLTGSLFDAVPLFLRMSAAAAAWLLAICLLREGRVALRDTERPVRVISDGVFRYIRHPLYLASLLFLLGLAATTVSLPAFAVWIVLFFFYDYIAGYEEKVMEEKFGEEYLRYESVTGRWLPRLF